MGWANLTFDQMSFQLAVSEAVIDCAGDQFAVVDHFLFAPPPVHVSVSACAANGSMTAPAAVRKQTASRRMPHVSFCLPCFTVVSYKVFEIIHEPVFLAFTVQATRLEKSSQKTFSIEV